MWLEGKRVVLTGPTRGIGRALAEQLVSRGAVVLGVARPSAALDRVAAELGAGFVPLPCDLADPVARAALLADLTGPLAPVDALINNAGIQVNRDYLTEDPQGVGDEIAAEVAVNLIAPLHLAAALAPYLAARPDGGVVLNITSALALVPKRSAPVYCATKAGLQSFTTALRYQAEGSGLRVVEGVMALVDTDMTAGRGRGKITAEQAAAEVLAGLENRQPRIWVGKTRALRLIHRLAPGLAARILRDS